MYYLNYFNDLETRMTSTYSNVFSSEGLEYLLGHPEVAIARDKLGDSQSSKVSFMVPLTDVIRDTLHGQFDLDVSIVSHIPMRWIVGDSAPHIDSGASKFQYSYLVYLNDSDGEFIVDGVSHPIRANTGYKFSEGLSHSTLGTGSVPRLLLGPMNELVEPVGGVSIFYFNTIEEILNDANYMAIQFTGVSFILGDSPNFYTGSIGSYTRWRIYSPSGFSSIYNNGLDLSTIGINPQTNVYVYPASAAPCFLEGTKILCQVDGADTYLAIESMRPGTLVKTSLNGYKKVELIGKGQIQNPGNSERIEQRLYKCSPARYPELTEDIYLTGCHSILVTKITDVEQETLVKQLGRIFVTDKKYRLTAFADERAEPWASEGQYTIWHFALENEDVKMNYGVYASGLLVETCCINRLKNKSGFTLVL
jgi:hypothetical protein